ncbi:hypothetical protein [Kitasatospora sp. NPDC005856]|uniref:hypothetical protein n=1 Tax=Kitasatospora sp. NPDC005856 TaxID=3154566 RepID=UPI0033BFC8CC
MSTTRERLLAKHRADLAQWSQEQASQPALPEDEYDALQRTQWLESARSYDPDANLAEELVLRLRGEAAEAGGLDLAVGGALLKPLHEMVAAAADRNVKLLLVGISPGSTVLHFRPQDEVAPPTVDGGPVHLPVESAVRKIIDLVAAAESGIPAEAWGDIEKGLGNLARVLDQFDLTADFRWMDSIGGVKSSSLTGQGRANVLAWHAPVPEVEPTRFSITGRITSLSDPGEAKVKTGASKKSKAYVVHFAPGELIGLNLTLGTNVAFTVEERTRITRGGEVISEHFFVSWDNRTLN